MARWRGRRTKQGRKKRDHCDSACDAAECGDCSPFLVSLVVASVAGYRSTPPVADGSRLSRSLLRLVRSYQLNVSALRPAVCNLTPTCSNYAAAAIRARGVAALPDVRRRLRRCGDAARG
ncbi:membrane protein insertion efficiency factor YidD [Nocardioides sp. J54]|uniref:membrane protein insertion efficiency factor YidD n=1 Tax=Nocardioides sp. J54 TaxID=935866 RepID=UPI0004B73931|nr:membrane protein insertion efficiency factor YidD [Nocardioides sp. J54]